MRSGGSFMSYQAKTTVLLIEPDASLRRLIALGLQYRGMHVIEASSLDHTPSLEAQTLDLLILDMDERVSSDYRSEEHTSELQSHSDLVCRLLLEKKKN